MSHVHHYSPPREELIKVLQTKTIPARFKRVTLALAVMGLGLFAVGAMMGVDRAWQSFLFNWLFFTTVASAGVMFVAVQRITVARWSRGVVRFLEGFAAFLPFAAIGFLLIIFGGRDHLYPWWNLVGTGELIPEKELWFGRAFFYGRSLVTFGAIVGLQLWFIWTALRLDVAVTPEYGAKWAAGIRARMRAGWGDERRELHTTHQKQGKIAVAMAIVFAFGWCVLAWDHSMSLDIHFFSTMYGWQVFMGGWLIALVIWGMSLRWWKKQFPELPQLITTEHYHDIGKLSFAFTVFWGYLTFSQFLIIWYGNLAEETHFFTLRLTGAWSNITMTAAVMTFLIPFIGLLPVKSKVTNAFLLFGLSGTIGLWLIRYVEVYPSIYGTSLETAPFGLWEIGISLGFLGLFGWSYAQFMDAFPKARVLLMTSKYRDEVQVPVDPVTMEPLPAHE